MAALLELGAGFNPEFTGRENIFLNGAILGLSNQEIGERLNRIIDFAGIGEFIDQPVKIYSSGMYIRLAFAIASSIDPDILIIDKSLAVGDGAFVIKCMNRMKQLKSYGTTIILVTHDVQTVRSFCDTALWLKDGVVQMAGAPIDVTSFYTYSTFSTSRKRQPYNHRVPFSTAGGRAKACQLACKDLVRWGSGDVRITSCWLDNGQGETRPTFEHGEPLRIEMDIEVQTDLDSNAVGFGMALRNRRGLDLITSTTLDEGYTLPPVRAGQSLQITFDLENILAPGDYALVLNAEDRQTGSPRYLDFIENAMIFRVVARQNIYSLVLPPIRQTVRLEDRILEEGK